MGIPFDASYAFGVNMILVAKSIYLFLPIVCIAMAIVTIYWTLSSDQAGRFWSALFVIGAIIGILAVYAIVIIPRFSAVALLETRERVLSKF
jgi:hypothetical protein